MISLYDHYQIELARWYNGDVSKGPKLKYRRYGRYILGGLGPLVKNDLLMIKERKLMFEELI